MLGTWMQIRPAPVTSDPTSGAIPTGYFIWNVTTGHIKRHTGWTPPFRVRGSCQWPGVAEPGRSPEHADGPAMSRASSAPTAAEGRDSAFPFSLYPCDPCNPWSIPGMFSDHGFHAFHGWAGQRVGKGEPVAAPNPAGRDG